jgi:hypothetical protein
MAARTRSLDGVLGFIWFLMLLTSCTQGGAQP